MVCQSHLQLSFVLYLGLPLDLLFSSASVELSLLLCALNWCWYFGTEGNHWWPSFKTRLAHIISCLAIFVTCIWSGLWFLLKLRRHTSHQHSSDVQACICTAYQLWPCKLNSHELCWFLWSQRHEAHKSKTKLDNGSGWYIVWYTSAAAVTIPTTDLAGATALCQVRARDQQFTLLIIRPRTWGGTLEQIIEWLELYVINVHINAIKKLYLFISGLT